MKSHANQTSSGTNRRFSDFYRSPWFWILLAAGVLRLASLSWGLPGTTGWEDDGVAPRDFLFGVYKTYAPGSFYTYPPLHLILLTTLTTPVWIPVLAGARSLAQADMIGAFLQVPAMTFFAVIARLVSVAMSLGTIVFVGKMAEAVGGRRAGLFAAIACALNAGLTYYGQVSNLDGPYFFWCSLSLWLWMRVIAERDLRHIRWAMLFAGAAVATKDQAYAIFLLSVPAALMLWLACDSWPRQQIRPLIGALAIWFAATVALLLFVDGAIINPIGFERRLQFLLGPASQGFASYDANWLGAWALLDDAWMLASSYLPTIAILFGLVGVIIGTMQAGRPESIRVAATIPLLAIISFTVAFNLVTLRADNRFVLPQTVLLAVYIGLFADWVVSQKRIWIRYAGGGLIFGVAIYALYQCIGIDRAFLRDPRYDAERWLAANVRAGQSIETYGDNVYLPRFPDDASLSRVDEGQLIGRNPVFRARESHEKFAGVEDRRPEFIVVSGQWVGAYLRDRKLGAGRKLPNDQQAAFENPEARAYFRRLFAGKLAYQLAHLSIYSSGNWPTPSAYESLTQSIYIFKRSQPASGVAFDGALRVM